MSALNGLSPKILEQLAESPLGSPGAATMVCAGDSPTPGPERTRGEVLAFLARHSVSSLASCREITDLLIGVGVITVRPGSDDEET